jgi:hypothetical protein
MRALLTFAVLSTLLMAGGALAGSGQVFGKGVAAADTVKVSELMANPDAFVGQTIRVQGTAVAVCAHRGCWVNIASDQEGQTVRVKVKDGEIVFPAELVGDQLLAEGVWTSNQLDLETTRKLCAADAEKHGKQFDPESVTECMTLYQLSGTGAVVVAR